MSQRHATMQDVARAAGVSHQTGSRVLNGHPYVSEAARTAVEAAIRELGYRRNTAARSLVTRRSQTIGILGSEVTAFGPSSTLWGVEQAAREAGYFVSIAGLREVTAASIADAVAHFGDQAVDGIVVVVPHPGTFETLRGLEAGVPSSRSARTASRGSRARAWTRSRARTTPSRTSRGSATAASGMSRGLRAGSTPPPARPGGGPPSPRRGHPRTSGAARVTGPRRTGTVSGSSSPTRSPGRTRCGTAGAADETVRAELVLRGTTGPPQG